MNKPPVAALCIADLHLWDRPPSCRAEADWFAVQERYLTQIGEVQKRYGGPPVICAGDVFHKWNTSPELVNFAMRHLPRPFYAVPGQHDLPYHNHGEVRRSAYWTLVLSKHVRDLGYYKPVGLGPLTLWGFPFGRKVRPPTESHSLAVNVAVVHRYVWAPGKGYQGAAAADDLTGKLADEFDGYRVAVFGDNHVPFELDHADGTTLVNCGSVLRTTADQVSHRPSVVLIYDNGTTERAYLDCSQDQFTDTDNKVGRPLIEVLGDLKDCDATLDFEKAVKRRLRREDPGEGVWREVLGALEEERK